MALADYLSAMRELILDEGLPATGAGVVRRTALATRFPRLAPSEIDSLAALPAERLQIYTNLVFAGRRGVLEWAFPVTLAAIHAMGLAAGDARAPREVYFELARDLHRRIPWSSASTRELAANFLRYLREFRADLSDGWPGLTELADCERVDLDVFYAPDEAHRPIGIGELAAMSVGQLLELEVFRPAYAVVRDYAFDVLALRDYWGEHRSLPGGLPDRSACRCACGRADATLLPTWRRLSEAGWHGLSCVGTGATSLGDVAEAYVAGRTEAGGRSERESFAEFFTECAGWLSAGIIMMRPDAGRAA
jgi:hypothetical protein